MAAIVTQFVPKARRELIPSPENIGGTVSQHRGNKDGHVVTGGRPFLLGHLGSLEVSPMGSF